MDRTDAAPDAAPAERVGDADVPFMGLPRKVAVVVAALMVLTVVMGAMAWGTTPRADGDTADYQAIASDLADGNVDALPDRTLGYPAILLATGSQSTLRPALFWLQIAAHLGACWMALCLLQRFRPSHSLSIVLAVVLLSPSLSEKSAWAMSEAVAELLLVAIALFLVRWLERRRPLDLIGASVAAGLASLVRPTFQALGFVIAIGAGWWLLRRGVRLRSALAAVATALVAFAAVVSPFVALNAARFDVIGLTPMLGWNLSTRTALFIDDLPASEPTRQILVDARNRNLVEGESHTGMLFAWSTREAVAEELDLGRPEVDEYMLRLNVGLILTHPVDYIAAVATAANGYASPSTLSTAAGDSNAIQAVYALGHYAVLAAFLLQLITVPGLMVARVLGAEVRGPFRQGSAMSTWSVCLGIAVYTAAVSTMIEAGSPRHRTPTDPLLLVCVAGGLWMTYRAFRDRAAPCAAPVAA